MQLNLEKKIFIIGGVVTLLIVVGGVFLLTKSENTNVSEDQIVTRRGLHWHPKVTVTLKGEKQEIPPNLGLGAIHQPMHTHDDNKEGVVHMEIQGVVTKDETKLGNFFRIWGKQFNSSTIFDKTNGPEGTLKMIVNGQESKDFENYMMRDGDSVEIRYE